MSKYCPNCGYKNENETKFCINCGNKFPPLFADDSYLDSEIPYAKTKEFISKEEKNVIYDFAPAIQEYVATRSQSAAKDIYDHSVTPFRHAISRFMKRDSESEIDDAIQEIFIKIFHKLDTLQAPEAYISWGLKISINYTINANKKKELQSKNTTHMTTNKDDGDSDVLDYMDNVEDVKREFKPEANLLSFEEWGLLKEYLKQIPEDQMRAIMLYKDGYSYEEIGEILGMKYGTARSNVSYAKKKLTKMITQAEKEGKISIRSMAPFTFVIWMLEQYDAAMEAQNAEAIAGAAEEGFRKLMENDSVKFDSNEFASSGNHTRNSDRLNSDQEKNVKTTGHTDSDHSVLDASSNSSAGSAGAAAVKGVAAAKTTTGFITTKGIIATTVIIGVVAGGGGIFLWNSNSKPNNTEETAVEENNSNDSDNLGNDISDNEQEVEEEQRLSFNNTDEFFTSITGQYWDETGIGQIMMIEDQNSEFADDTNFTYMISFDHGDFMTDADVVNIDGDSCWFYVDMYSTYYRFDDDGTYLHVYYGASIDTCNEAVGAYKYNQDAPDSEEVKALYDQNFSEAIRTLPYGTYSMDLTSDFMPDDSQYNCSKITCTIYKQNNIPYMRLEAYDLQGNMIDSLDEEMILTGGGLLLIID